MIDPGKVCLFIPSNLKEFKLDLFERIGKHIVSLGGQVARHDAGILAALPDEIIPIVGCQPESTALIKAWRARGRPWIYWDRGYARRVFATWLPRGDAGGFYRWHLNSFQMTRIRDCPADRWLSLKTEIKPWRDGEGKHILLAAPSATYERFHDIVGWTARTLRELSNLTTRQIVVRDKESKRPLWDDCAGAYCMVTHGSNAAVEAALMGCPVIVDASSAAALVGRTKLQDIQQVIMPDRGAWARSLAYSQFNEAELVDGTLWRLMT